MAHDADAATMIISKGRLGLSSLMPLGKGIFVFNPEIEPDTVDDCVAAGAGSALCTNKAVYTRQLP